MGKIVKYDMQTANIISPALCDKDLLGIALF